jgi:Tol biopolymer transport system component
VTHFALRQIVVLANTDANSESVTETNHIRRVNMDRIRLARRPVHNFVLGLLLVAGSMHMGATFPGKNGRIAFVLWPDIYTMSPDGSDVKQLTHLPPDSGAFWQSWSPNGKQIVFNEFRPPDFLGQLWLMNADGTNQHLLLAEPDFNDVTPSFSPDGAWIVFSRCRTDIEACALHQIGTDGTVLRPITDFELGIQDFWPEYSPGNNGSVAFTSQNRGGFISAIYLEPALNAGLRRLSPVPLTAFEPDWSPDGNRITFSSHFGTPQNEEIWVTNVERRSLRQLTDNGNDYFTGPHDFHPSWSPQGDAIVFERDAPDFSSSGIFIMRADGSGCRQLMTLPTVARANAAHVRGIRALGRRGMGSRHLKQIEAGGALPQWGVAPH